MSLPWLAGDDRFLIWATSAIKFQNRELPATEDIALINVSYDLELIDRFGEYDFPVGNQVITNRLKLYEFFAILNKQEAKPKQIICDIFFRDEPPNDDLLRGELELRDDVVLSYYLNDSLMSLYLLFDKVDRGLSDYLTMNIFEGVYKYHFYHDSIMLTPLRVYQKINTDPIKNAGHFSK